MERNASVGTAAGNTTEGCDIWPKRRNHPDHLEYAWLDAAFAREPAMPTEQTKPAKPAKPDEIASSTVTLSLGQKLELFVDNSISVRTIGWSTLGSLIRQAGDSPTG
jgi:hypothetical protein